MSEALDKTKAILAVLKEEGGFDGANSRHMDLLMVARVQVEVAQAEALERLADHFDWTRT